MHIIVGCACVLVDAYVCMGSLFIRMSLDVTSDNYHELVGDSS